MVKRLFAIPVIAGLLVVVACGKSIEEKFTEVYCTKGHECRSKFESKPIGKMLFTAAFGNSVEECKEKFSAKDGSTSDGGTADGGTVVKRCVLDEAKAQKCLAELAKTKCEDLKNALEGNCKNVCK